MEQELDAHNIRGSDRALGRHFADLDPQKQVLSLFAFQLAQRAQIDNFAAADFLRSDIYEAIGRIKTALLPPYLSNYATLLQEWILSNMLSAKDAWRMEEKMYRMRDKGAGVNGITIKLAPKGVAIKEYHRARVAWILLATVEFDELCEQREQKPQQFWDWIGSRLVALKTRIATDPQYTTEAARRHKLNSVFSHALTMHRDQFPPKGPAAPHKPRPAWQETLEVAMDLGAVV
ncbi:hypothetical protein BDV93DRAFT_566404 [Ceratobasidium sp. AG-I]|nr:hypothetical protein BDV93DRAFT_566404 [Ceratobasidium sp. AG-I]